MTRSWIDPKLAAAFAVVTVTAVAIPRADAKCDPSQCGMNTAVLRQTRIDALHLGGKVNPDGVSLDVTSFRLDPWKEVFCRHIKARFEVFGRPIPIRRAPPLFLTIIDGELAAVDGGWDNPAPNERHRALCLVGATFTVRVPPREATGPVEEVRVRLQRFGRLETWVEGKTEFAVANEQISTYLVIDRGTDLRSVDDDAPLCPALPPMEAWQLRDDHSPPGVGGVDQGLPTAHAALYQGEVYDDSGTLVEHPERTGPGWFYFTCPRTALHKARLMGMNPMNKQLAQPPAMRQATIKMLTARYDGASAQTGEEIPLVWVPGDRIAARNLQRLYAGTNYGSLDGQGVDGPVDPTATLEAVWGPSGALCLSEHPRVWDSGIGDKQVPFKKLLRQLYADNAEAAHRKQFNALPLCSELERVPDAVWTTYSPRHDHL